MCDQNLIPLSVFELDFDKPVVGWGPLFDAEDVVVVEDSIGRPAISCEAAGRLIGARRAAHAYHEAERERQMAEFAARFPIAGGIPAVEGLSAVEQCCWRARVTGPPASSRSCSTASWPMGRGRDVDVHSSR